MPTYRVVVMLELSSRVKAWSPREAMDIVIQFCHGEEGGRIRDHIVNVLAEAAVLESEAQYDQYYE